MRKKLAILIAVCLVNTGCPIGKSGNSTPEGNNDETLPAARPTGSCQSTFPAVSNQMQFWLDATRLDGPFVDGEKIDAWPDCGPSGNGASQSNFESRPQFISSGPNGLPAVNFTNGYAVMSIANSGLSFVSGIAVALVMRLNYASQLPPSSYENGIFSKGYTLANGFWLGTDYAIGKNFLYIHSKGSGQGVSSTGGVVLNDWMIVTAMMDPSGLGNLQISANGGTMGSYLGTSYATNTEDFVIGGRNSSFYGTNVDIAEIAAFDGVLSDTDRRSIECYFKTKYSISDYTGSCPL